MGLAASQARFTSLIARKSNLEYRGQQINQQRTTLSSQSSAMNNQLLSIKVPTPPSSDSFTKTTYTYSSNGEQRTVVAPVIPDKNGTYTINYTTDRTVAKGKSTGTTMFVNDNGTYKTLGGQVLNQIITDTNDPNYSAVDNANLNIIASDAGIKDANGNSYGDTGYTMPTFYSYTSNNQTKYELASDLQTGTANGTAISTYVVDQNYQETTTNKLEGAEVDWSDSGRMSTIRDADGNEFKLNVITVKDSAAYEDAMNEYDYKKTLYDQTLDNINAKTGVIQSQDKNLELKLKSIDTDHKAVQTELDAIKKVIDKNIESSFKTFA